MDCHICGKSNALSATYYNGYGIVTEEICEKCNDAMAECSACGTLHDDSDYVGEFDCVCCEDEDECDSD